MQQEKKKKKQQATVRSFSLFAWLFLLIFPQGPDVCRALPVLRPGPGRLGQASPALAFPVLRHSARPRGRKHKAFLEVGGSLEPQRFVKLCWVLMSAWKTGRYLFFGGVEMGGGSPHSIVKVSLDWLKLVDFECFFVFFWCLVHRSFFWFALVFLKRTLTKKNMNPNKTQY